jgi:hypothetical protein
MMRNYRLIMEILDTLWPRIRSEKGDVHQWNALMVAFIPSFLHLLLYSLEIHIPEGKMS